MVRSIPRGQVTTYGQVARLVGYPNHSRMVGSALRMLGADYGTGEAGDSDPVPWQRVVSSAGTISKRESDAMRRQAELLEEEGVVVTGREGRAMSEHGGRIDLTVYGWFPDRVELD